MAGQHSLHGGCSNDPLAAHGVVHTLHVMQRNIGLKAIQYNGDIMSIQHWALLTSSVACRSPCP
jgi:hypothetical protein